SLPRGAGPDWATSISPGTSSGFEGCRRDVSFDAVPEIETADNPPLTFLPNGPLSLAGFTVAILPKGRGSTIRASSRRARRPVWI
uniref:hypothetical protein n=1 Tax=Escherichia coli TaxID=562 RepID=UPI001952BED1